MRRDRPEVGHLEAFDSNGFLNPADEGFAIRPDHVRNFFKPLDSLAIRGAGELDFNGFPLQRVPDVF